MSPRKPSSVFLVMEHPSGTNMPPMLQVERIPLKDDVSLEQVIQEHLQAQALGTVMHVIEDTKVDSYSVGLKLDPIDDARLVEPPEAEGVQT